MQERATLHFLVLTASGSLISPTHTPKQHQQSGRTILSSSMGKEKVSSLSVYLKISDLSSDTSLCLRGVNDEGMALVVDGQSLAKVIELDRFSPCYRKSSI